MQFGDVVRRLLDERMISQKKLAEMLNISPSTLGNYIRNLRQPDFDTVKKIAAFFSVSTDYLFDYNADTALCNDTEKELLRIYRAISSEQQKIYLEQGRAIIKATSKDPSSP